MARRCRRAARRRVHLALLPMEDADENAAIVNALQRRADVVVQKSLAEGFGLTVAEAMWKGRPVVASRVGGIQDQIEDGVTGCARRRRPTSRAFGERISELLADPHAAERIGEAAQARVRDQFLGPRHSASTSTCSSASSHPPRRSDRDARSSRGLESVGYADAGERYRA